MTKIDLIVVVVADWVGVMILAVGGLRVLYRIAEKMMAESGIP